MFKELKKKCQVESWRKHQKKVERLPSCDDLNRFIKSKFRSALLSKLRNCNDETNSTYSELVALDGLIFIELSLDNAKRTGKIRHLTLGDFNKGKLNKAGNLTVKIY